MEYYILRRLLSDYHHFAIVSDKNDLEKAVLEAVNEEIDNENICTSAFDLDKNGYAEIDLDMDGEEFSEKIEIIQICLYEWN